MKAAIAFGLSLLCATSLAAQKDIDIETCSGVKLKGKLKSASGNKLEIEHPELGTIRTQTDDCNSVTLDGEQALHFQRTRRDDIEIGSLKSEKGKLVFLGADGSVLDTSKLYKLAFEPYSLWNFSGTLGATVDYQSGNTDEVTYGTDLTMMLINPIHEFRFNLNASYKEVDNTVDDQTVSATLQYNWWFSRTLSAFASEELKHNQSRDLRISAQTAAGLTWRFAEADDGTWEIDLNGGFHFTNEDYKLDDDRSFGGMLLGVSAGYRLPFGYVAAASALWRASFDDKEDSTLSVRGSLTGQIFEQVSLSFRGEYDFDNVPAANREKEDIRLYLVLGWVFA